VVVPYRNSCCLTQKALAEDASLAQDAGSGRWLRTLAQDAAGCGGGKRMYLPAAAPDDGEPYVSEAVQVTAGFLHRHLSLS
jgi:hypothetical protein